MGIPCSREALGRGPTRRSALGSGARNVLIVDAAARAELRFPAAPAVRVRVVHFSNPGGSRPSSRAAQSQT